MVAKFTLLTGITSVILCKIFSKTSNVWKRLPLCLSQGFYFWFLEYAHTGSHTQKAKVSFLITKKFCLKKNACDSLFLKIFRKHLHSSFITLCSKMNPGIFFKVKKTSLALTYRGNKIICRCAPISVKYSLVETRSAKMLSQIVAFQKL